MVLCEPKSYRKLEIKLPILALMKMGLDASKIQ
jgi:hypothetical protein